MKKIDMILNGTKEQYPSLISKLSNILEPFALLAVGKAPVYIGRIVEELGVKQYKDCGAFIFNIDGNDVAHVDTKRMEASVFGGETFSISIEDAESVRNTVDALENRKAVTMTLMKTLLRTSSRVCLRNSSLFSVQLL